MNKEKNIRATNLANRVVKLHDKTTKFSLIEKLENSLKPVVSVWLAVLFSSITYAGVVIITLLSDAAFSFIFHRMFGGDAPLIAMASPVVITILSWGKYSIVALEVLAYLYSVYKELKRHSDN